MGASVSKVFWHYAYEGGPFSLILVGMFPLFFCFLVLFWRARPGTLSLLSVELWPSKAASPYATFPFLLLTSDTADDKSWLLLRFSGLTFYHCQNQHNYHHKWVDWLLYRQIHGLSLIFDALAVGKFALALGLFLVPSLI